MAYNIFNAAQYDNSALMGQLIQKQQDQQRQNAADFSTGLSSSIANAAGALDSYADNQLLKQNTNEDGTLNQESYLKAVALQDPAKAQALRQQLLQQQLANQKATSEIAKNNAAANASQAVATVNSVKSHVDAGNYLANMISSANSQEDMDRILNNAQSRGLDVSEFQGQKFTPELKQKAMDLAIGYAKSAQLELDRIQTGINQQNANTNSFNANNNAVKDAQDIGIRNQQLGINQQNANSAAVNANAQQQNARNTADQNKLMKNQQVQEKVNEANTKFNDTISQFRNAASAATRGLTTVRQMLSNANSINQQGQGFITTLKQNAPASLGGTANFASDIATLKSQTFLSNIQAMKGFGALSNAEGDKISSAIATLNNNISPEKFREQLLTIAQSFQVSIDGMKSDYQRSLDSHNDLLKTYDNSSAKLQSNNNSNVNQNNVIQQPAPAMNNSQSDLSFQ